MDRFRCPSCGSRYNGKRCTNCLYTHFGEEISHGMHIHQGEPLVISSPTRKPIPRKDPFDCDPKTRKTRQFPKWLVGLLIVLLLEPTLDLGISLIEALSEISYSVSQPATPEPMAPVPAIPAVCQELYSDENFTVSVGEFTEDFYFPVILRNNTDRDVYLGTSRIVVDGFRSDLSVVWIEAPAGSISTGELWLDEADLSYAFLGQPHQIDLTYYITDSDSYDTLLEHQATFYVSDSSEFPAAIDPGGVTILDDEQVRISFLPEDSCADYLMVYVENKSEQFLSIYAETMVVQDTAMNTFFRTELPGGTRTVTRLWLEEPADIDWNSENEVTFPDLVLNLY